MFKFFAFSAPAIETLELCTYDCETLLTFNCNLVYIADSITWVVHTTLFRMMFVQIQRM